MAIPLATAGLNLVTSFKFEIGAAVTQSNNLTNALKKVSDQAQLVQDNLKLTTISASKYITGLEGGMLSFTKNLVMMSEELYASQLKLATLMAGNASKLRIEGIGGAREKIPEDFGEIMRLSEGVLTRSVSNLAKLGIDANEAKYTFSEIAALLVPKNAAGRNFENVEKMTRNVLLGASTLNLSPGQAAGQIQTLIQGRAMEGMGIFDRLKAETDEFSKTTASQFNRLIRADKVKGIEKINRAFDQYLNKTGRLEAHYNQLSVQLTILKNNFSGVASPLVEFGKLIRVELIDMLKNINTMLASELPKLTKALMSLFKVIVRDVEFFYVQLRKTTSLSRTFEKSFKISTAIGVVAILVWVYQLLFRGLSKILVSLGLISATVGKTSGLLVGTLTFFKMFSFVIKGISKVLTFGGSAVLTVATRFKVVFLKLIFIVATGILNFLAVFATFFTVFRMFDSARAQAEVRDIKRLKLGGDLATFFADLVKSINILLTPFRMLIDHVGAIIAPIFSFSFWLEKLRDMLEAVGLVGNTMVEKADMIAKHMVGIFTYVVVYVSYITEHIKNILYHSLRLDFQGLIENFKHLTDSFDLTMKTALMNAEKERKRQTISSTETAETPKTIVSVDKVEIRNQFPENLEPDRIATSISDSFKNQINQIDTTSRPQTYSSGSLYSGAGFGG